MALPSAFPTNFTVNPRLTAITISYTNPDLIADMVLPRVDVSTPTFLFSRWNQADMFTIPETKVGRTSEVNQVDWNATQDSSFVEDHALDEIVPRRDQAISAAYPNSPDPKALAVMQVSQLLALGREQRTANLIFNPASYNAANKVTLSGTSQWSDFTNSDPLAQILAAKDSMIMRPNKLVIGQSVWTKLRTHPKIVSASLGNNGQYGAATKEFVAELLELDEILVGQSWGNLNAKGTTPSLTRLWGKSAALMYVNPVSANTETPTFGITPEWGTRMTAEFFDFKKGMRGSDLVRVGESVRELILANDFGYFFQNAVA